MPARQILAALAVTALVLAAPRLLPRAAPRPVPAGNTPFVPAEGAPLAAALLAGGRLDLNRATAEDLAALPGIGRKRARRIVAWRAAAGGFQDVEELRRVPGIGEKTMDRIRPLVSVAR